MLSYSNILEQCNKYYLEKINNKYDIPKEFAGLKVCQLGNDDTFNNIMAEIANVVKTE